MKNEIKILCILLCTAGMILIGGCIGEKSGDTQLELEKKQIELENKQLELKDKQLDFEKRQSDLEDKQSDLEKKQSELEKRQYDLEKKQSKLEEEFNLRINETGSKIEVAGIEPEWCNSTSAEKYGRPGDAIWIEGVVEFKGLEMCHIRYFLTSAAGTTQNDWYFTKQNDAVYRVISYPGGKIEEIKIV
jgi:hypothetical protein